MSEAESNSQDDNQDDNSFSDLELPSMTPGSLARKFGPGMMLMMTGIGTRPPGDRASCRRQVRLCIALVPADRVHIQILRLRNGDSFHARHWP